MLIPSGYKKTKLSFVCQGLLQSLKASRMMDLGLHRQNGKERVTALLISQDVTSKYIYILIYVKFKLSTVQ